MSRRRAPALARIEGPARRSRQAAILLLFFLSGMSGLLYEVVWLRMAIRVFGSTAQATAIVLAAFMAGLALGSLVLGSRADRARSPLRLYAALELGAAASALMVTVGLPALLPLYRAIYAATGESRGLLTAAQAVLLFAALLAPTALMGGTLPALTAELARGRSVFGSRVGALYGLNTLGAVLGAAASGLWLLGAIGERRTVLAGALIQAGVAVVAGLLARASTGHGSRVSPESASGRPAPISPYPDRTRRVVLLAFAASGFAALGYEVIWTRVLPVLLLTSVYAFTGMLAVYLAGIALGSLLGRRLADRAADPVGVLALLEAAAALAVLLGFAVLIPVARVLGLTADTGATLDFYQGFPLRLLVAAVAVFPATLALGATFPLAARSHAQDEGTAGRSVGRLYALNTLGCIAGSLAVGFVLLPHLGSAASIAALALVGLAVSLGLAATDPGRFRSRGFTAALGTLAAGTALAAFAVPDPYRQLIEEHVRASGAGVFFHGEDAAATTTASGRSGVPRSYRLWVNGEGMTVMVTETKLMAYIPLVTARDPRDMLILCFGMGTTFRSAMIHGGVRVDTVELVPDVYEVAGFYHADAPEMLRRAEVGRHVDDARNFLALNDEHYDVITMDPPPPLEAAGVVNFYAREFHELCLSRLKPGGVVCLWVPPAVASEVAMVLRTFADAYPFVTVWGGPVFPGFYLLGSREPLDPDPRKVAALYARPEVAADLTQLEPSTSTADVFLGLRLGTRDDLLRFTEGSPIVTDDRPRTEFPLWRRLRAPGGETYLSAVDFYRWLHARDAAASR